MLMKSHPHPGIRSIVVQHAPGVGRRLAEYIIVGEFRSIDLAPLSYERFLKNAPLCELNVI